MGNIWNMLKIPEQKKVSPFWGGIKDILSRAMFYSSGDNLKLLEKRLEPLEKRLVSRENDTS